MERGRSDAYRTPDVSITMRCFAGAVRRFVARFTGVEDDLTTIAWKNGKNGEGRMGTHTNSLLVGRMGTHTNSLLQKYEVWGHTQTHCCVKYGDTHKLIVARCEAINKEAV